MNKIYIGLGTNLGNREFYLKSAIERIGSLIGKVTRSSSVYETEPVGFKSNDLFLNMVREVETGLEPSVVMETLLGIEKLIGRVREGDHYSSRVIDLDILLFDDRVIESDFVTVPHPGIPRRRFVLIPLCEINPDLVHLPTGKTISKLLGECTDISFVRPYYSNPLSAKLK